jgi:hypothetical protein
MDVLSLRKHVKIAMASSGKSGRERGFDRGVFVEMVLHGVTGGSSACGESTASVTTLEENDKRIRLAVVGMRRIAIDGAARGRDIDGSSDRTHHDATARR